MDTRVESAEILCVFCNHPATERLFVRGTRTDEERELAVCELHYKNFAVHTSPVHKKNTT